MRSTSILPSSAPSIPIDETPSEAKNFTNKILRFACHCLRTCGIIFSSISLRSIRWEKKYWTHWRGDKFYFKNSQNFSKEVTQDPRYQKLLAQYCTKHNTKEWKAKIALRMNLRKGMCHGTSMALMQAVKAGPEIELEHLELDEKKSTLYQSLEFFRGNLELETIPDIPQPLKIDSFTIEGQVDIGAKLQENLENSKSLLIRAWKGSKAHTFFLHTSKENNHYYFFNSQGAGLFRFNTDNELIEAFSSHVKEQSPYGKAGTSWQIEGY